MPQTPPKREVADALVERGSVFVYLDPRKDGVVVPEHLGKQPQLVLQVGLGLAIPIHDLEIDEEGIFGTLSFNRAPFYCRMPWHAVFGLFGDDGMGVVWQEDFPSEVASEIAHKTRQAAAGPSLRAISGGADEAPEPEPEAEPKARPHLRLVK